MVEALEIAPMVIEQQPGLRWIVVRTKARCEKKVAELCERTGIVCYLPLRHSVRRYQNRIVTFMVPIFGGYVFTQIDPSNRKALEESRHVAHTIVPDELMEKVLVRELNDLLILERATTDGELVVRPEIAVGTEVRIGSGPLAGINGIVVRRKRQARVAVNIDLIGHSVSVEIDVGEIDRIL